MEETGYSSEMDSNDSGRGSYLGLTRLHFERRDNRCRFRIHRACPIVLRPTTAILSRYCQPFGPQRSKADIGIVNVCCARNPVGTYRRCNRFAFIAHPTFTPSLDNARYQPDSSVWCPFFHFRIVYLVILTIRDSLWKLSPMGVVCARCCWWCKQSCCCPTCSP